MGNDERRTLIGEWIEEAARKAGHEIKVHWQLVEIDLSIMDPKKYTGPGNQVWKAIITRGAEPVGSIGFTDMEIALCETEQNANVKTRVAQAVAKL